MDKKLPLVSCIILMRNEKAFIEKTIESVLMNDYPKDKLEILVVDGMSKDGSREILEGIAIKDHRVKLLDNNKRITPAAMNIGIKNAKGDVIILLSGHSYIAKDYIRLCVKYLEKTKADCVGGPMRAVGTNHVGKAISLLHHSFFGMGGGKFHDVNYEGYVDTVYLGAYRREVFEKVGYYDERLVRNQDIEMNARIRKSGGKVYLTPEIRSYYYPRSTLRDFSKQSFRNGLWNIYTTKVARGSLSLRHFVPVAFVLSLLVSGGLAILAVPGRILLGVVGGSYLLGALLASIKIGMQEGLRFLPILPLAFFTLHFSYGLGSLWGLLTVWRFGANEERKEN